MSTKVYAGFLWDATDLASMMSQLGMVQVRLKKMCNERKASALATMAAERIDRACMALADGKTLCAEEAVSAPLREAHNEMQARQKEILVTSHRDPAVDFEVKIAMWYVPDLKGFVGHVLSEDREASYKLIRRQPGVCDYGYWNNTDRPKRVTKAEWTHRKQIWDRVFDQEFGMPLVVTVDADIWVDKTLISRKIPAYEQRVRDIAVEKAYPRWLSATNTQGVKPDANNLGQVMSLYMRYERQTRKQESVAAQLLAEEVDRVGRLLPRDVRPLLYKYEDARVTELLDTAVGV